MNTKAKIVEIDSDYLVNSLLELLSIPSPTGLTDEIVHFVSGKLTDLKLTHELTRRGAIRCSLSSDATKDIFGRAIVTHLDTLGAMVKELKSNGRLRLLPVGTWSSRFAEGTRGTLFTDKGSLRGTILPLMASGHTYNEKVDTQPVSWSNIEFRIDEWSKSKEELTELGVQVGDFIAIDSQPEIIENGFINARFLDDKAGVACVLTALKAIMEHKLEVPVPTFPLFTISEEVGSGASSILQGSISEMVSVDIAIAGPEQESVENALTIVHMDSSGPFDYHLSKKLKNICHSSGLNYKTDVFEHYRSDSAAAVEAGNDIRTALVGFGTDASHGCERTHLDSLKAVTQLLIQYAISPSTFPRDKNPLGPIKGFPHQIDKDDLPKPDQQLPDPAELLDK